MLWVSVKAKARRLGTAASIALRTSGIAVMGMTAGAFWADRGERNRCRVQSAPHLRRRRATSGSEAERVAAQGARDPAANLPQARPACAPFHPPPLARAQPAPARSRRCFRHRPEPLTGPASREEARLRRTGSWVRVLCGPEGRSRRASASLLSTPRIELSPACHVRVTAPPLRTQDHCQGEAGYDAGALVQL